MLTDSSLPTLTISGLSAWEEVPRALLDDTMRSAQKAQQQQIKRPWIKNALLVSKTRNAWRAVDVKIKPRECVLGARIVIQP